MRPEIEIRDASTVRLVSPFVVAFGHGFGIAGAIATVCALVLMVWNSRRSQPLSSTVLPTVVLVLSSVVGFVAGLARYRAERVKPHLRVDSAHSDARVVCYVPREEMPLFREIVPELFEPEVMKYIDGLSGPFWSRISFRYPFLSFGGPLLLGLCLFTYRWYWGAVWMLLLLVSNRLPPTLWPRYLRVSPGCLELLASARWSESVKVVKQVSLHAPQRVGVFLNEGIVRVSEDRGTDGAGVAIGLGGLEDSRAAAIAIVRGALAPATDAPLPADSLCG